MTWRGSALRLRPATATKRRLRLRQIRQHQRQRRLGVAACTCPPPRPPPSLTLSLSLPLCVDIFYTLPHSCAARINQATLLRLSIRPSAGALIASLVLELWSWGCLHLASAELSWPPTCANCPHHCASFPVRIMAHWLQILFSFCLPLLLLTVPAACTVHHCVKTLLRGKFMCWSW